MFSTELLPRPAVRVWSLTHRFQKFLVVGAGGLAVNQAMLFILAHLVGLRLTVASPVAIAISMLVTFFLNEMWTWHDRGTGRILHRGVLYATVNSGGLAINTGVLLFLEREAAIHYLIANLIGAGLAAVWNFVLNHFVTWRS